MMQMMQMMQTMQMMQMMQGGMGGFGGGFGGGMPCFGGNTNININFGNQGMPMFPPMY